MSLKFCSDLSSNTLKFSTHKPLKQHCIWLFIISNTRNKAFAKILYRFVAFFMTRLKKAYFQFIKALVAILLLLINPCFVIWHWLTAIFRIGKLTTELKFPVCFTTVLQLHIFVKPWRWKTLSLKRSFEYLEISFLR